MVLFWYLAHVRSPYSALLLIPPRNKTRLLRIYSPLSSGATLVIRRSLPPLFTPQQPQEPDFVLYFEF